MALCAAGDDELVRDAVDFVSVVKRNVRRSVLIVGCKRLVELGLRRGTTESDKLMDLGLSGFEAIGATKHFGDYGERIPTRAEFPRSAERIERATHGEERGK
jgi:hypothetical protein